MHFLVLRIHCRALGKSGYTWFPQWRDFFRIPVEGKLQYSARSHVIQVFLIDSDNKSSEKILGTNVLKES
jgi:hypothetical protein